MLNRAGDGELVVTAAERDIDRLRKIGKGQVLRIGERHCKRVCARNRRSEQLLGIGGFGFAGLIGGERRLLHRRKFIGQVCRTEPRAVPVGGQTSCEAVGRAVEQREIHRQSDGGDIRGRSGVDGEGLTGNIAHLVSGIGECGGGNAAHVRNGNGNRPGFRRTVARAVHRGHGVDTGLTRQPSRVGKAAVIGASHFRAVAVHDVIRHRDIIRRTRPAQQYFRTHQRRAQIGRHTRRCGIGSRRRTGTRRRASASVALAVHGIERVAVIAVGGDAFVEIGIGTSRHFREGSAVAVNHISGDFVNRRVPAQFDGGNAFGFGGEIRGRFHDLFRHDRRFTAHREGDCLTGGGEQRTFHGDGGNVFAVRQPRELHTVRVDIGECVLSYHCAVGAVHSNASRRMQRPGGAVACGFTAVGAAGNVFHRVAAAVQQLVTQCHVAARTVFRLIAGKGRMERERSGDTAAAAEIARERDNRVGSVSPFGGTEGQVNRRFAEVLRHDAAQIIAARPCHARVGQPIKGIHRHAADLAVHAVGLSVDTAVRGQIRSAHRRSACGGRTVRGGRRGDTGDLPASVGLEGDVHRVACCFVSEVNGKNRRDRGSAVQLGTVALCRHCALITLSHRQEGITRLAGRIGGCHRLTGHPRAAFIFEQHAEIRV